MYCWHLQVLSQILALCDGKITSSPFCPCPIKFWFGFLFAGYFLYFFSKLWVLYPTTLVQLKLLSYLHLYGYWAWIAKTVHSSKIISTTRLNAILIFLFIFTHGWINAEGSLFQVDGHHSIWSMVRLLTALSVPVVFTPCYICRCRESEIIQDDLQVLKMCNIISCFPYQNTEDFVEYATKSEAVSVKFHRSAKLKTEIKLIFVFVMFIKHSRLHWLVSWWKPSHRFLLVLVGYFYIEICWIQWVT